MREFLVTVLAAAMATAPAWAHGPHATIRTPAYGGAITLGGQTAYRHNGHHHGTRCHYVPGYYQTIAQQVWVDGRFRQNYVSPAYARKIIRGVTIAVPVSGGYYTKVWIPGHYKTVTRQVWRDGYWNCCP